MISPDEIKKQALKWWKPLLQSVINAESFFPKKIDRIGAIQPDHITARFEILQKEIALLNRYSKNQTGIGYLVKMGERNFRRTGSHKLPEAIIFESLEDYLHFTGKKSEWKLFLVNLEKITRSIPQLKEWLLKNCVYLTDSQIMWDDVVKVCSYFLDNPRPNLYIRQLPIDIHTKFIENNASLIQSLLDFLIPEHIRNPLQQRFAERYSLKYDEPLIRMRILDTCVKYFGNFSDISIPLSDFERMELAAENILIAENKMNFLALPSTQSTIAVWSGGGFNISYLRNAEWLAGKNIFYWGDIDEHGFQILHQLRSYYPQTRSILMDSRTFERFQEFAVTGARNKAVQLPFLTDEEANLYNQLKVSARNRLEQEKIPQGYVDELLKIAIAGKNEI